MSHGFRTCKQITLFLSAGLKCNPYIAMMIIEYNIDKYLLSDMASVSDAITCLGNSKERIVFCVNSSRKLTGLLTNGDLLRWLVDSDERDFSQNVSSIFNKDFAKIYENEAVNQSKVESLIQKFRYIPVLDTQNHIIGIARPRRETELISIGEHEISQSSPTYIIAEIGNNHNGDINLARKLVELAKKSGADCVKFQLRDMSSLYASSDQSGDADNLGTQYTLDLLRRFQLSEEELFSVFDYCKEIGIQPLCTPWDLESLKKLEEYGMPGYKVASADLTNHDFLQQLARTGKPLIVSTGMSEAYEIEEASRVLKDAGAHFIFLHCNSTYPAPFSDINLLYMKELQKLSDGLVGYSSHERGIHIPVGAVALGAKVIEKHFTIDKSMEGNDHKVSLLPEEFREMTKNIRETELSLGHDHGRTLSQGELMNRVNLAKSLIINTEVSQGDTIEERMIEIKSPGKGLQPNKKLLLIGQPSKRDMKVGDFFYPSDLLAAPITAKPYEFPIQWGVPVRYHDFSLMMETAPDLQFVEFHLSYMDLDIEIEKYLAGQYKIDFAVHSPELFAGDHIMDLCRSDKKYRNHSIMELERVINTTINLKQYFPNTQKPLIIVNVGGFTNSSPLSKPERKDLYRLVHESINSVNSDEVEIIPQTMPPFPWHMGGQQFHNLFVDPDEIHDFCSEFGMRLCFDVSHSGLACNHNHYSFSEFVQIALPHTAHLHLADALGQDGEGMQIFDGDLDFKMLFNEISQHSADISFIPEIWQGHENSGEGFWIALSRLEQLINR